MSDLQCEEFQQTVAKFLIRHQSILDILSKSQEANARLNRAVTKAVTSCGCLKIHAEKKPLPSDANLNEMKEYYSTQLEGYICDNCKDIITTEMGKYLFYLTALCNTLNIDLQEVLEQENTKVNALGKFNMT